MQKIVHNKIKILLVLLFFLVTLFVFSFSCFASSGNVLPNNTQELISKYDTDEFGHCKYLIANNYLNDTYLLFSNSMFFNKDQGTVNGKSSQYYINIFCSQPAEGNGTNGVFYFFYKLVGNEWKSVTVLDETVGSNYASSRVLTLAYSAEDIFTDENLLQYSNNILYTNNAFSALGIDEDTKVFPVAPVQTELAQIVTQTKPETTLQEVILLIPIVMIIVVSLIGLRKALKLLQTFLRSS